MIDGIKLQCNYINHEKWINKDELMFPLLIDNKTGEILPQKRIAKYKGLQFNIIPSNKYQNVKYLSINGSLHKFFNYGEDNLNDYTIQDLKETITKLINEYGIIPEKTKIQNIEFGVNLELPIEANKFINSIISNPEKRFTQLDINKVKIGKVCSKSEYSIKIYDKGLQSKTNIKNIVRFELKIKKMRFLSKYDIQYLSDLLNPDAIQSLKDLLINTYDNLIIYDNDIDFNILTNREKLQISNFKNPLFWENLNKSQRYKKRKAFKQLINKYKADITQERIKHLLKDKLDKIASYEAEKKRPFHQVKNRNSSLRKATFSPLEYRVKTSPPIEDNNRNLSKKPKHKNKRYCKTCGRDITRQRNNSIFCSEKYIGKKAKKCRNAASNARRKIRNKEKIYKEQNNLSILKKHLESKKRFYIKLGYKNGTIKKKRGDLLTMTSKQVCKVVYVKTHNMEFTTSRAKQVVKTLMGVK